MTTTWVARIPLSNLDSLGRMRTYGGIEAMTMGEHVFVRGACETATLPSNVRALPGLLYTALEDDQLVEHQRRAPSAHMPIGHWMPLDQYLQIGLPQAVLDAERPLPVSLRIVRSNVVREANLLQTPAGAWRQYADSASDLRLRRLRFTIAANRDEALIHGDPLPPLPGVRWVECHGIAVPAGWDWSPRLDADVVAAGFGVQPGELVLLHSDGRCERLDEMVFAPAHRAAVRDAISDAGNRDAGEETRS